MADQTSASKPPAGVPGGELPAPTKAAADAFIASLMDTDLYSMGAYFCDSHPELIDEVVERSEQIEADGLAGFASNSDSPLEEVFGTLLTGLAVRYYKAVAG